MNDFKKVFFLVLLTGLVIAPQAARAAAPTATISPANGATNIPVGANITIESVEK